MSIILMLNLKGGVAKTTNAVAIAEAMAEAGKRVLVIDADHQCMASELLIGPARLERCENSRRTLHDMLSTMLAPEFDTETIPRYIVNQVSLIGEGFPGLDLLPCSIRIDDFQTNVARARRGYKDADEFQRDLKRGLAALERYMRGQYDFVLVDCPPTIALQVKQFIGIADSFVIPCVPDTLSVRGSFWLLDRLRRMNVKRIQPLGTLWSLYRAQAAVHREVIQRTEAGEMPFSALPEPFVTVIPNAVSVAAAMDPFSEEHPPTFREKYGTNIARLYRQAAEELEMRSARLARRLNAPR